MVWEVEPQYDLGEQSFVLSSQSYRSEMESNAERERNERERARIHQLRVTRRWLTSVTALAVFGAVLSAITFSKAKQAETSRIDAQRNAEVAARSSKLADQTAKNALALRSKAEESEIEVAKQRELAVEQLRKSWVSRIQMHAEEHSRGLLELRRDQETGKLGSFRWWSEKLLQNPKDEGALAAVKAQLIHTRHAILLARLRHPYPARKVISAGEDGEYLAVAFSLATASSDAYSSAALWRCSDWRLAYQTPPRVSASATNICFRPPLSLRLEYQDATTDQYAIFAAPQSKANPFRNYVYFSDSMDAFIGPGAIFVNNETILSATTVEAARILPRRLDFTSVDLSKNVRARIFHVPTVDGETDGHYVEEFDPYIESGKLVVRAGLDRIAIDQGGWADVTWTWLGRDSAIDREVEKSIVVPIIPMISSERERISLSTPGLLAVADKYTIRTDTMHDGEDVGMTLNTVLQGKIDEIRDEGGQAQAEDNGRKRSGWLPAEIVGSLQDVSSDGLALLINEEFMQIVSLREPRETWFTIPHPSRLTTGTFLEGKRVAVGDEFGCVYVWQLLDRRPVDKAVAVERTGVARHARNGLFEKDKRAVGNTRDSNLLDQVREKKFAVVEVAGEDCVLEAKSGRTVWKLPKRDIKRRTLISPTGKYVADTWVNKPDLGDGSRHVQLFDLASGKAMSEPIAFSASIYDDAFVDMDFVGDDSVFACVGGNEIHAWMLGQNAVHSMFPCAGVYQLKASASCAMFVANSSAMDGSVTFCKYDSTANVWRKKRCVLPDIAIHGSDWSCATFSENGGIFACIVGGWVYAVSTTHGELILPPFEVDTSPDGYEPLEIQILADGQIRLVCCLTGEEGEAKPEAAMYESFIPLLQDVRSSKEGKLLLEVARSVASAERSDGLAEPSSMLSSKLGGSYDAPWLFDIGAALGNRSLKGEYDAILYSACFELRYLLGASTKMSSLRYIINAPHMDAWKMTLRRSFLEYLMADRSEGCFRNVICLAFLGEANSAKSLLQVLRNEKAIASVNDPWKDSERQANWHRAEMCFAEASVDASALSSSENATRLRECLVLIDELCLEATVSKMESLRSMISMLPNRYADPMMRRFYKSATTQPKSQPTPTPSER